MNTKITKLNPEIQSISLYKEQDLRIHSISKLVNVETHGNTTEICVCSLPISEGVGIEYSADGESYIVICFVEVDENGKIKTNPVGSRVREYKKKHLDNIIRYNKFKKIAKQLIKEAQKKEGV
jgi:hypothetical protein